MMASAVMATESVNYENSTSERGVDAAATEIGFGSTALEQVNGDAQLFAYVSSIEEADVTKCDGHTPNDAPVLAQKVTAVVTTAASDFNMKMLLCRRFKDSGGISRNFNSLPLFVYATSTKTHATSADGIGVGRELATTAILRGMNDFYHVTLCTENNNSNSAMNGLPSSSTGSTTLHLNPMTSTNAIVSAASYQQHINLNNHRQLLPHHSKYSNNYHLHRHIGPEHVHTEQTKSLQELQHEVGALLEFRDLVIETFPDLKHKMTSMSSSASATAAVLGGGTASGLVSGTNTLTGIGLMSGASTVSRREWEPGIRMKRKLPQKEPCTSALANIGTSIGGTAIAALPIAGELSSSSMPRSRSNSHSGKKEPKSGENNNGSVVQDSGFSTETSSSKEGHSASSTNGAITIANASNRNACTESDDELMNLLDVIHRKSTRLREEVEQLQKYEPHVLPTGKEDAVNATPPSESIKSVSIGDNNTTAGLTPQSFHGHLERINKEDIPQLRKDRDRLLEKLAEMEAETLTGRFKEAKMNEQIEELISTKKDLEEQLKLAMAQKLELSSRVQQLQQQQSKSSSSGHSDYSSSQRFNILSSAATVLSTGNGRTPLDGSPASSAPNRSNSVTPSTFHAVGIDQKDSTMFSEATKELSPFQQSQSSFIGQLQQPLGRLDGIVSTPDSRNSKCRVTDSKRFQAILLETNVIELQRHLLTLTVQNQVTAEQLNQATKSKINLVKRLDRSKEDIEDLRFQLEEKNIELEGTKAQLRVLESRMVSSTPSTTTSYTHSQHDYETNRSSASTTLMLNRRGDSHLTDSCSGTPTSAINIFSAATANQISTPSMKAMTHLYMDEAQQHSSSTESTHDLQHGLSKTINKIMSASVGGTSPFAQTQNQHLKRLGQPSVSSKPSKIPLPGSKAGAYFAGKPPTGRPYTAGRSPPSTNISTGSHTSNSNSNKFSLSRSTSNLNCVKSPSSLKRTDSAQSIRKDTASSLNTSRSSTSSIPMPTTPYSSRTLTSHLTPSTRVLPNSPVPKPKRDSLTSRVRHLDSLSRVHQQNISNEFNNSSHGGSHKTVSPNGDGSYVVASTPKTSIVTQFSSSVRKDLQLSSSSFSHGSQQFLRRATGGNAYNATGVCVPSTTRRFSSASAVGARIAGGRVHGRDGDLYVQNVSTGSSNSTSSAPSVHIASSEQHNPADNDSGKKLVFLNCRNTSFAKDKNKCDNTGSIKWCQTVDKLSNCNTNHNSSSNCDTTNGNGLTTERQSTQLLMLDRGKYQDHLLRPTHFTFPQIDSVAKATDFQNPPMSNEYWHPCIELLNNNGTRICKNSNEINTDTLSNNEAQSFSSNFAEGMKRKPNGSNDNLLLTFDYGFCNSIEYQVIEDNVKTNCYDDEVRNSGDEGDANETQIWLPAPQIRHNADQFPVYHMQYNNIDGYMSYLSTSIECDQDDGEILPFSTNYIKVNDDASEDNCEEA